MENPNLETNDWDWEVIPNSDEHLHSTDSPLFGGGGGGGGVIRSDHFSVEGLELDNPSWVDNFNQGFTGIEHLDFPNHSAKSSEIVHNCGNNDADITSSVTAVSVHLAKSSEIVQNRGKVTGFSYDFAKSLEIVQKSGKNYLGIDLVTGFSDHLAESSEIVQNSGNNDTEINNLVTGISDRFVKSLEITSLTGLSDHYSKSSEIVHQNCGNEDVEGTSVTVLSDHSSKSSEIVHQNCGNEDVEVSFSGEYAEEQEQEQHGDCLNSEDDNEKKREQNENENENEKRVVWWKVPLDLLKYCVLRVNPVWSLSMAAAALMGFVLLRRRYLYKMKRKNMSVQVNVTVHDKKVSQLMSQSQAARLNEAFSMVKRIPIIRPALPAPGMASWPVMSLR